MMFQPRRTPFEELVAAAREAERDGELDAALEAYEGALDSLTEDVGSARRADVLRWIGTVRRMRDEVAEARAAYEASLEVARGRGDDRRVASALNCLGTLDQLGGTLEDAERRYREARGLAVDCGDESLAAMLDQNLATLANIRGDIEVAIESYESALGRLMYQEEHGAAANVLNNLGMAFVDLGEWARASSCFDRAFALAERLRDAGLLADIDLNRGELCLRQGKLAEARENCDRAFEGLSRIGSDAGRGEALKLYGLIARESKRPFLAENHLNNALDLAVTSGDRLLEAEVEAERARAHLEQERNREALQCLNRAYRVFTELEARRELYDLDRRLDGLEQTYMAVVARWSESIEAKDRYTAGHCQRVAEYACLLAEDQGFHGRELTWFRMGGFLHDVGKTAVPEEVLNKRGALTSEEWALMQSHTTVGHEIVESLRFPWDIPAMVRSHHERWDGSGYPDALAGEEIPLTARILCLADVYDALTTTRSYRAALSHDEAMGIMEGDCGKIFDPRLFGRFRELLEGRRERDDASATASRAAVRPSPRRNVPTTMMGS